MRTGLAAALAGALALGTAGTAYANPQAEALLKKHNCTQCHSSDKKILGPGYKEVAKKYKGQKDVAKLLAGRVKKGAKGVWGQVPMPPNDKVPDAEIKQMVDYILTL